MFLEECEHFKECYYIELEFSQYVKGLDEKVEKAGGKKIKDGYRKEDMEDDIEQLLFLENFLFNFQLFL